ncbi:hypothetical protein [Streptomyces europaeiscabiei]|uniref:hypothetical protein n=1 Tax=Streptomyces europaeiscabiei TaxID=146819 RepID=UPI000E6A1BE6|nr:hypothetical protein [Streptomyces europaeiscabiei]
MTARLTQAEIIAELRDALAEGGWISAATKEDGPGPLPREAAMLSDVADALAEQSRAASLSSPVALQLGRAAEAAADALAAELSGDESAVYGMLGTALAYVVQARRVAETPEAPA